MAFIIDSYNKYDAWDRAHSLYKFEINGNWYAIKEVEMSWGLPQLGQKVDQDYERQRQWMHIYETYEEASKFAQFMKGIN